MLEKQELLSLLKNALEMEERAVPIFTKHLGTAVFWAGLGKERDEKIKKILERLALETNSHKIIVSDLIKKIEEDNRGAF